METAQRLSKNLRQLLNICDYFRSHPSAWRHSFTLIQAHPQSPPAGQACQVPVEPRNDSAPFRLFVPPTRQRNKPSIGQLRKMPQMLCDFDTAHVRHTNVKENKVGPKFNCQRNTSLSIMRGNGHMTQDIEEFRKRLRSIYIVIDDKDTARY